MAETTVIPQDMTTVQDHPRDIFSDSPQEMTTVQDDVSTDTTDTLQMNSSFNLQLSIQLPFQIVTACLALFGNLLLVWVVNHLPNSKLRKTTKVLMQYVSLSHCIPSLILILRLFNVPCVFLQLGALNSVFNVQCGLAYLGYEVLVMVAKPYSHQKFISMNICMVGILCSCLASLCLTVIGYLTMKEPEDPSCNFVNGVFNPVFLCLYMGFIDVIILVTSTMQIFTLRAMKRVFPGTGTMHINVIHVAPVNTNAIHVAPVDTNAIHVAPVDINAIHVAPVDINVIHVAPVDINAIHVAPVDTNAIHVAPVDINAIHVAPVDTNAIHVAPVDINAIHVAPVDINAIHVAPVDINAIHVAPVDINVIHVAPVDINAIHVAPVHINVIHVAPVDTNAIHVAPVDINAIHVAPVNTNAIHVAPVNTNAIHVAPVDTNAIHVAPVDINAIHVAPVDTNAIHVAPVNTNVIHVAPVNTNAIHVAPANINAIHVAAVNNISPAATPGQNFPLKNLTKILTCSLLCSIISWLPSTISFITFSIFEMLQIDVPVKNQIVAGFSFLLGCNGILYVIVYVTLSSQIRQAVKKYLSSCICQNNPLFGMFCAKCNQ